MTTAWVRKIFYECVACVCLTFGTIFFAEWVFYGNWVPNACEYYIICFTNWFIQISLDSEKGLFTKVFLKDTKLLVWLRWPSGKQSTFFNSCFSSLVSLTCSILSAKTDPLVCVDLVCWNDLNQCFLYVFLKCLFSRCWAFWTLLCFPVWKELPTAHYQKVVHSWEKFCHWIGTWKMCTDSPRAGSWNRVNQVFVAAL